MDIHNESNPLTLSKKRNFRWALADEVILTGRRASSIERMARKSMEWLGGVNGRAGKAPRQEKPLGKAGAFCSLQSVPIKKRFLR